jgi:two-component sensor histidine kinase
LSSPDGRISVHWEPAAGASDDGAAATLAIAWRETGGPSIAASTQSGYGTSLIRDLIPHELGGTVDLEMAPDGVRCTIVIPLDRT